MLWEIDGFEVEILLQQEPGVRIVQWDEFSRSVYVQANLSKEEAIWCIRKLSAARTIPAADYAIDQLALFDCTWPLKIDAQKKQPFIKQGIVYASCSGLNLSSVQRAALQVDLLQQQIMKSISIWEERLNILIPTIAFRKIKTKPFSICLKRELITFDKDLHRLKIEVLDYGVFLAISTYVKQEEKTNAGFKMQYFPSYKNYDKILAYEYSFGDSD